MLEKTKEFEQQIRNDLSAQAKQECEEFERKRHEEQRKIDEIKAEHDRIEGELKEAVKIITEVAPLHCTKIAADVIREAKIVRVSKWPLQTSIWSPNAYGVWTKHNEIINELATIVKQKVSSESQNQYKESSLT